MFTLHDNETEHELKHGHTDAFKDTYTGMNMDTDKDAGHGMDTKHGRGGSTSLHDHLQWRDTVCLHIKKILHPYPLVFQHGVR